LLAGALGLGLVGCADCAYHDGVRARAAYSPTSRKAAAHPVTRPATPKVAASAEPAREEPSAIPAKPHMQTVVVERPPTLQPQNEARFHLLENIEAVGMSRSFTGERTDPNGCAERCLAASGCDAFSFEKETQLCFLVSQVKDMTANGSFVSGRLR
jgi:hypothetical protein